MLNALFGGSKNNGDEASSALQGLMMYEPMLISNILKYADTFHGDREIVSRRTEGDTHRYTYRDMHRRTKQLARALIALGVKPGDRVATLAWNGYRHMELYYAVSGIGAVCHTINPRLFPDQVAWIANHAEDVVLFFDATFAPLVDAIAPKCETVRKFISLSEAGAAPSLSMDVASYEDLLAAESDDFEWPVFDERTASGLCYTSGTTGNPKGVLYSHRSTLIHAYSTAMPDAMNLRAVDSVLPIVPMFHVNAWGMPYLAPMVGAKLVMPGPHLDGASIYSVIEDEGVTFSAAVPTVWQGLLGHLDEHKLKLSTFKRCVIGGSAAPVILQQRFEEEFGVEVIHAWGMTEMSPLGTMNWPKAKHVNETRDEKYVRKANQGRPIFGLEMKIVNDAGEAQPWDGSAVGELHVRGPAVCAAYFKGAKGSHTDDGWFGTGDVAAIDEDGYLRITDRAKDVVKSGGEWISSIDLENLALKHPAVAQAAVIGLPHPKWDERPLLVIVLRPGAEATREDILEFFDGKVAKWWIPDDVAFVDTIPLGATGKILKTQLRDDFKDHSWPNG
jgi:fatty-acyl-CoA synthase